MLGRFTISWKRRFLREPRLNRGSSGAHVHARRNPRQVFEASPLSCFPPRIASSDFFRSHGTHRLSTPLTAALYYRVKDKRLLPPAATSYLQTNVGGDVASFNGDQPTMRRYFFLHPLVLCARNRVSSLSVKRCLWVWIGFGMFGRISQIDGTIY